MARAACLIVFAIAFFAAAANAADAPAYASVGDALTAAGNAPTLSTLLAAVQAANLTIPADAVWTIFAPTNEAFQDAAIQEKTGLSAAQLLEPANKEALIAVLSYHVVPAAAVASTQLTDGQVVDTLLQNATLTVSLAGGGVQINDANVTAADIKAGNSIIHVIDKVLLPPALVKN